MILATEEEFAREEAYNEGTRIGEAQAQARIRKLEDALRMVIDFERMDADLFEMEYGFHPEDGGLAGEVESVLGEDK